MRAIRLLAYENQSLTKSRADSNRRLAQLTKGLIHKLSLFF